MSRTIIAIDLDDVLNDLVETWLAEYHLLTGDGLRIEEITSWGIAGFAKCSDDEFHAMLNPRMYGSVRPTRVADDAIRLAASFADVYIVTAYKGYPGITDAKVLWCERNLPMWLVTDLVFANDKSRFRCDWMIDDNPRNLEAQWQGLGSAMLIEKPWNRSETRFLHAPDVLNAVRTIMNTMGYVDV